MKSSPRSPQLEKAHVQQLRPIAAKNKEINEWKNKDVVYIYTMEYYSAIKSIK